jgi:hypothetical protein
MMRVENLTTQGTKGHKGFTDFPWCSFVPFVVKCLP